ncbi:MAG TPA: monooxygenase [Dermatophilaceae bacterium]|nr:monooxygenase [Dermatophilaceae bacterium]
MSGRPESPPRTAGDLLVVGGGPAGLATALYAVRAGLDVTVREPRAGDIDKACGEGLMPGALARLLDLGVDPPGHDLEGIRYVAAPRGRRRSPGTAAEDGIPVGTSSAQARFRAGPGRGVRRTTLHAALREAVAAAGVVVEPVAVREVRPEADGVVVDGRRFGHVVAADGLHSPVRRGLGLDGPPTRLRRWGLRRHFAVTPWTSFVEVHWAPQAEAYVTPVGPHEVGVAVLSRTRRSFDGQLADFPALRDRLGGAPGGDVRGAGVLRQRTRARTAGRVLLVGDAAGYVDALTGEGIALALTSAQAAVAAVVAGDPQRYERAWPALTRRYRWLTIGLVQATRPAPVRASLVPLAQRLPSAFGAAVDALARPA